MKTLFTDLPLCREIQRALADAEHVHPTPIQAAAIPHVLEGRDLLGCAQTGTGKTAAFALPVLHSLATSRKALIPRAPHVLILCPTRELAAQIQQSFSRYGRHLRVRQTAVYGGVNQNPQVRALKQGVHVLVATPGRLIDLMDQGHVKLDQIQTLILDEADRMLDMGFLPPLKKIVKSLPDERQSLCFSATMPREIAELVNSMLRDPHRIDIAPQSSTTEQVEQQMVEVEQSAKRDALCNLLQAGHAHRVLVFTRTKRRADQVARQLHQADISADAIHGDKTQRARTHALDRFKHGRIRVLVATDVAARGIDVQGVSHVINYDLPHDAESYVHRIGRTGRAEAVGVAITFFEPGERRQIRAIERLIGRTLLPGGGERRERRESTGAVGKRPQGGASARRSNRQRGFQSKSRGNGQEGTSGRGAESSTARGPKRPPHKRKATATNGKLRRPAGTVQEKRQQATTTAAVQVQTTVSEGVERPIGNQRGPSGAERRRRRRERRREAAQA
jgi:ATP-dependent RNA helicase RhlE